ncbi:ATP-binding protein [Fretibacter rubidus]|uniref:ATP-binding protein n=1 Tax=Fretibacter rubidus TaxID=570162 RepID=UPI00352A1165
MLEISEIDILNRIRRDNTWWENGTDKILEKDFPKRDYFPAFYHLVSQRNIKRAVVLMGPRQVGKTVMAKQAVYDLLSAGETPNHIFFSSLDTPIMMGKGLETILRLYVDNFGDETAGGWIIFDEVQYLKDWEIHLKSLVDSYPQYKFVVTGSAAAVLKRKSQESGAGRFSDFILPPLSYKEFLRFQKIDYNSDIAILNNAFMDYLAYGGYPEIVLNEKLQDSAQQYLKSDIIDKVLLRDLPSLYGVTDVQEMHRLFSTLVYNTSQEISLEKLSHNSGVSKATLKKYIEYFEGAFLIRKLSRIDENAKSFKRERTFKVYITNPSLYAALFGALDIDDPKMGALAETAVLAQTFNGFSSSLFSYARWRDGKTDREVDLVSLNKYSLKPETAIEVKWSDRIKNNVSEASNIAAFSLKNNLSGHSVLITTRTFQSSINFRAANIYCSTTVSYCWSMAEFAINRLEDEVGLSIDKP